MENVIELKTKQKGVDQNGVVMEWLVFQLCLHGPEAQPDDWISVHPEDLPSWVMDPEVVADMRKGKMVCSDPHKGRLWFRVIKVDGPEDAKYRPGGYAA